MKIVHDLFTDAYHWYCISVEHPLLFLSYSFLRVNTQLFYFALSIKTNWHKFDKGQYFEVWAKARLVHMLPGKSGF